MKKSSNVGPKKFPLVPSEAKYSSLPQLQNKVLQLDQSRTIKTMVSAILDQSVIPESKLGLCFEMMSHFWATVFGLHMFDRTL